MVDPDGRLWRPSAAVADDRAMSQWRIRWLEVEMPSLQDPREHSLDAIRRPRNTPIWKLEAALKCWSCKKGRAASSHDQADPRARDHALRLGSS
jgi:hypothetical protein